MMKRRLAIWMYIRALKMEPMIALGVQQAANELAEARLVAAVQELQQAEAHAQHQQNVARIARSN